MTGGVFDRIVCGVDGTPEGFEAVRQAARLAPEGAALHLFHAIDLAPATSVAWVAPEVGSAMAAGAADALEQALALVPGGTARSVDGPPAPCLLAEIERVGASLVAVGTHGTSRAEGILLGSTTARMLHDAPCSVLVTRPCEDGPFEPRKVFVGVDGSEQSAHAVQAARALAERIGASLTGVIARGGKDVDVDAARALVPDAAIDEASPVDALVAAAMNADLMVIGSRGLHGLRSLGSVSERVAHRAQCSVLVVRGPR